MAKPSVPAPLVTLSCLEKITGIRAHTFRTWEQRYALFKNERPSGDWRVYTLHQTRLLLHIALLNKAGYKISDIAKLGESTIAEKALALATDELKQGKAVYALFLHYLAIEADHFEMVLNSCVQHWGLHKTITGVLIPFLEKTGLLYHSSNTTAETLVLSLVQHKLIAGIEQLSPHAGAGKAVLLFLPEKQHHEPALLYMYYLLKRQGVPVLYLGGNVQMDHIKNIAQEKSFNAFYTCFFKKQKAGSLAKLASYIAEKLPATALIVLNAANATYVQQSSQVTCFRSIHDTHRMMPE